jgi:hypothetical protein
MFRDFFVQITGQPLTEDQGEAIQQTITELDKREAQA